MFKNKKIIKGFTIIELVVVVAIIGTLATVGVLGYENIQSDSKDAQKSSQISIISNELEKYYIKNGEYPSCAQMTASPTTVVTVTLKGLDPDVLTAPTGTKGTNSITCVEPTASTFSYLGGGDSYILKYQNDGDQSVSSVDSEHQGIVTNYTLTINAGTGGTVNTGGSYTGGSTQTITATPATYYDFTSWSGDTGCSGIASHTITMDSDKTCTATFTPTPIPQPTQTAVSAAVLDASTHRWSWNPVSCTAGSTARYYYRETIALTSTMVVGFDSGYVGPQAGTTVDFTTSTQGQTYTVYVKTECHNATTNTDSPMSTPLSAAYARPILPANTIVIGSQVWMTANANTGTRINAGVDQANNAIIEKYCYNNLESNCTIYGGLYHWDEALKWDMYTGTWVQGVCPTDFHVPLDSEYKTLEMSLGMTQLQADGTGYRGVDQGTKLKVGGSSGFEGQLAGYESGGAFAWMDNTGYFWTSSPYGGSAAYFRSLSSANVKSYRLNSPSWNYGKSVRCVWNYTP